VRSTATTKAYARSGPDAMSAAATAITTGGDSLRGVPWNFRHALVGARISPRLPADE
jgi:hypothetical protein